jgi:putative SOS response-associated peptidase YedK
MCGRYKLTSPPEALERILQASGSPNFPERYNITPTQQAAVVCHSGAVGRILMLMRWGLIPGNSSTGPKGKLLINARSEAIATVASFKSAYRSRRCLVPADGFYEWAVTPSGRQPHLFRRKDQAVFCFAGVWETWQGRHGTQPIESFTILTTAASKFVRPIHHRMPVILSAEQYAGWLGEVPASQLELSKMAVPGKDNDFVVYPVSKLVNTPANDDARCVKPVDSKDQGDEIGRLL